MHITCKEYGTSAENKNKCCGFSVYLDILLRDSCGDPLFVMFKTDQIAENFLQDEWGGGGAEGKEG